MSGQKVVVGCYAHILYCLCSFPARHNDFVLCAEDIHKTFSDNILYSLHRITEVFVG